MRRAFTLIELLVVVSIIALLIAILLPALSQSRYTAQVTQCKAVLRGIGGVQLAYAIDNKENLPTDGYRYGTNGEAGSWVDAQEKKAQVRSWELKARNGNWDLMPIYRDYMQQDDTDAALNCPLSSHLFTRNDREEHIISYMIYVTNNYRVKHFYFEDVGAYEKTEKPWSPFGQPDVDFTMLASDFVFGQFSPHGKPEFQGALSAHPGTSGYKHEHLANINDAGGYILGPTNSAPLNFVDGDGSVRTFKVNANSYQDTEQWVLHNQGNHRNALLPRELAR